jgi:4-amino-4-deoxy-L-arabinose transferase-like glycosyltransferase
MTAPQLPWHQRLDAFPAWIPGLIFLLGVALLLPSIWSETSITASDEYVLTFRTPMEMQERGQFLTPYCNEEPRLRKPPLMYWLILGAYKTVGVNLVAARIWAVLAGAGLALVACLLERELFRTTGLLAGLLSLSSIGLAASARQAMLDLPLAFFAALAVWQFVRWRRTHFWGDLLGCAVWLGISFLLKGPVGMLFFLAGAGGALWATGDWRLLREHAGQWLLWLLVLAAICLPWPLAMHLIWSDRFSDILGEEISARQFGKSTGMAPLSALGGALGLIAPWTLAVILAAWEHVRKPRREDPAERNPLLSLRGKPQTERPSAISGLIAWVVISVIPFFFMQAFERYMLAVLPAQAVIASVWLQREGRAQQIALGVGVVIVAVAASAFAAFAFWFKLAFWLPLLACALIGWLFWHVNRSRFGGTAPSLALGAAVLLTVVLGGIYPVLGLSNLPPDVRQTVGPRVARTFNSNQPGLLSMRLGYSVQYFRADRLQPGQTEVVFVEAAAGLQFEEAARSAGLTAREISRFPTLYSRKAWARFARHDATAQDWLTAFRNRSLDDLRSQFLIFEVTRPS